MKEVEVNTKRTIEPDWAIKALSFHSKQSKKKKSWRITFTFWMPSKHVSIFEKREGLDSYKYIVVEYDSAESGSTIMKLFSPEVKSYFNITKPWEQGEQKYLSVKLVCSRMINLTALESLSLRMWP